MKKENVIDPTVLEQVIKHGKVTIEFGNIFSEWDEREFIATICTLMDMYSHKNAKDRFELLESITNLYLLTALTSL